MMPPAPPQFDADTPLRGHEAPHAPQAPSARTARPSARFFDSEAEFAASPPPHAGVCALQWVHAMLVSLPPQESSGLQ